MEIKFFLRAKDFLSHAGEVLVKDEVRYGLICGIAKRLIGDPHAYGEIDPWFYTLDDETGVQAAAMRTPPYKVLLAHFSGDPALNAALLAGSILTISKNIPGVVGDKEIADRFVEYWCQAHKATVEGKMAQRVYRLLRINDIEFAPGKLRIASMEDQVLLERWAHSFHQDVYASSSLNVPEDNVIPKMVRKEVYVWEDAFPVSMAAKDGPTENGVRINLVYTPPELRHQGYATSCVASLCREILESGYKYCMLYTDLANPISNSIYQKIGFAAVCDSVEYAFSNPSQ
jgi:predicted GNAT family acetyltransferase